MKPAVQVSLAILLVGVLVYLMYSQSGDKTERESPAAEEVVSDESASEDPEATDAGDLAAIDSVDTDGPDDAQLKQVSQEKAKRAQASLRERRRNMFKKIDSGQKDGLASKEEHDAFFRKAFNFYDKDDDGRLTGKEIDQVKRLPPKADVNKDGILTRKEFLDQFDHFFVTMDKDKSGDLTEKEFVR